MIFTQLMSLLYEDKTEHLVSTMGEKILAAAKKEGSKLKTAEDVVKELIKATPDQKHIVWVTRMYVGGKFRLEDIPRMKDELASFERLKARMANKDLNSYKDLTSLYDAIEAAEPSDEEKKQDELKALMNSKSTDVEWLVRGPKYKALIPKTKEAACKYGANTKWCTAGKNSNQYEYYTSSGDLVIIIVQFSDGNWRKFQFHYERAQFMDERDDPVPRSDIKEMSKHPEHIKWLMMMSDKHEAEDDE